MSAFKHFNCKAWDQSLKIDNSWPPFCQIWIIFTRLKFAIHNFKWVKIQIENSNEITWRLNGNQVPVFPKKYIDEGQVTGISQFLMRLPFERNAQLDCLI